MAACLGREHGTSLSTFETDTDFPLFDATDGRVYALTASNLVATSGSPNALPCIVLHAHLEPGTYVILAATERPGQEAGFGLTIESTETLVTQQLWPPKGPRDDNAAAEAMSSGAGEAVRKGLQSVMERVMGSAVQGKEQAKKARAQLREQQRTFEEQARLRAKLRRKARPAGMDDSTSGLTLFSRGLQIVLTSRLGVPFGLTGVTPALQARLSSLLAAEVRGLRSGDDRRRHVRARCLLRTMRDSVQVLPPVRIGDSKYATTRAMEEEQTAKAALEQVMGTASDPEVALQLSILDMPLFRYAGERARVVPGLEILSSLPMNLERLCKPLLSEEEKATVLEEAALFAGRIEELFAQNKKLDEADAAKRNEQLVSERTQQRTLAAAKATKEAEAAALKGRKALAGVVEGDKKGERREEEEEEEEDEEEEE